MLIRTGTERSMGRRRIQGGYPDILKRMAKILISLDDDLVARIDWEARRRGLSRSSFLSRLASRELNMRTGPGSRASVQGALSALESLFARHGVPENATAAIRQERDSR